MTTKPKVVDPQRQGGQVASPIRGHGKRSLKNLDDPVNWDELTVKQFSRDHPPHNNRYYEA